MPDPISISVNDPVSADVQAVCGTLTAACNFFCTPQGQALLAVALKDAAAAHKAISDGWGSFIKLFHA